MPSSSAWEADFMLRFLFIGFVAGVVSMYLYYSGLKLMSAGQVSFIELSYPALGMIFSALYTFEALTMLQIIGSASFFAFISLMISRQKADLRSPTSPS